MPWPAWPALPVWDAAPPAWPELPAEGVVAPGWPPLADPGEPGVPWLPCEPLFCPGCGKDAVPPPELVDGEDGLPDSDPPLLEGEDEGDELGEGIPPDDPGDPGLPLEGELGTGMPGMLGWVMTVWLRQPASSAAAKPAVAARNWLWPNIYCLPAIAASGAHGVPANPPITRD